MLNVVDLTLLRSGLAMAGAAASSLAGCGAIQAVRHSWSIPCPCALVRQTEPSSLCEPEPETCDQRDRVARCQTDECTVTAPSRETSAHLDSTDARRRPAAWEGHVLALPFCASDQVGWGSKRPRGVPRGWRGVQSGDSRARREGYSGGTPRHPRISRG